MKVRNNIIRIISIYLILTVMIAFSVPLFAQTADQRYKNRTPIPSVLEQNLSKIKRINDYGPEFVLEYVSEGSNYYEIISTLTDIKLLSDELCLGITNDYSKITIIAKYVADTIAYDHDAAHNAVTFDIICLKNVLSKKRTTCAGYSNLFSALLNAQGIYCVNIRGCSPDAANDIYMSNLDSDKAAINHEWAAAWYAAEERWVYVDCTWNSRNAYKDGEFIIRPSVTTFFDISIEHLSIEHRAEIVDYRNFFSAPEAFNEDGIRWSDVEGEISKYTTVTTPITSKKSENTDKKTSDTQSSSEKASSSSTEVVTTPESLDSDDEKSSEQSEDYTTLDEESELSSDVTTPPQTSESDNIAEPISKKDGGKAKYIIIFVTVMLAAGGGVSYCFIKKKKDI